MSSLSDCFMLILFASLDLKDKEQQLRQVSDNTLSQVLTEYVEAANRGLNMLVSRRYFFSCCSTNSKFPLVAF